MGTCTYLGRLMQTVTLVKSAEILFHNRLWIIGTDQITSKRDTLCHGQPKPNKLHSASSTLRGSGNHRGRCTWRRTWSAIRPPHLTRPRAIISARQIVFTLSLEERRRYTLRVSHRRLRLHARMFASSVFFSCCCFERCCVAVCLTCAAPPKP